MLLIRYACSDGLTSVILTILLKIEGVADLYTKGTVRFHLTTWL